MLKYDVKQRLWVTHELIGNRRGGECVFVRKQGKNGAPTTGCPPSEEQEDDGYLLMFTHVPDLSGGYGQSGAPPPVSELYIIDAKTMAAQPVRFSLENRSLAPSWC